MLYVLIRNGKEWANMKTYKYLRSVIIKEGSLVEEWREGVQQSRKYSGTLKAVARSTTVSMEMKKLL